MPSFSYFSIRGDRPMPSNRYRLQMRGNIVQLTLKQSQKDDTGQYALVATKIGQPFEKGSTRRIHLRVDEPSYEEGEPPIFLRRLTDLAVKVGTRTRFLVEIRSSTNPKVSRQRLILSDKDHFLASISNCRENKKIRNRLKNPGP